MHSVRGVVCKGEGHGFNNIVSLSVVKDDGFVKGEKKKRKKRNQI